MQLDFEGTCLTCIHLEECDEIGGRREGRGYGAMCGFPDVEPRYERREGVAVDVADIGAASFEEWEAGLDRGE